MWKKSIEEWRALGVAYAIMPHWYVIHEPEVLYPDDTVVLKTYPKNSDFRGPSMVVLRLYPMQNETNQQLGSIRLVGYDLNGIQFEVGEDIVLRHYWRAERPTSTAHQVYNHLLNEAGEIVTQTDYVPLWDARRDTTTWDDPDEIMLGREFILSLPADLSPGSYQLVSGFYDPLTWQRLTNDEGADRVIIGEIEIVGH